ncbi:hypothetical protein DVK01_20280 [Haloarcula sp. Atlit-120R]|nr:hypothetical protein DVK01_20280 [Haloarcula sp. Atlit-120R]
MEVLDKGRVGDVADGNLTVAPGVRRDRGAVLAADGPVLVAIGRDWLDFAVGHAVDVGVVAEVLEVDDGRRALANDCIIGRTSDPDRDGAGAWRVDGLDV